MSTFASWFFLFISTLTTTTTAVYVPETITHPKRTSGGIHLPLYKREVPANPLKRRDGLSTSIGLGDFVDITYNVLVDMGGTEMPLVVDTGSSDVWAISDACTESICQNGLPLYPQATFQSAGIDARLFYGDSLTGTHAFGEVGTDVVGIAGITVPTQYFAAINETNTTVPTTGSSGILGFGFPLNSVIWSDLFRKQFPLDTPPPSKREKRRTPQFPRLGSLLGGSRRALQSRIADAVAPYMPDYHRTRFPDLTSLLPTTPSGASIQQRQTQANNPSLSDLLSTFATNGPLVSRLAQSNALSQPLFTLTLQRNTFTSGGNTPIGTLSLGDFPTGLTNQSFTWVPLRGYTAAEGGLPSTTDIYPIAWEVPIDSVELDGSPLPDSKLSPDISVTALIDSGNSLLRGPQDVVQSLMNRLTLTDNGNAPTGTYSCSQPHSLVFTIGGQKFPIDPRDFGTQATKDSLRNCVPNVVSTDPPRNGFLYSWSLGDQLFKSTIVAFYFGNLTHPSQDPPRIGFMSVMPTSANQLYQEAMSAAKQNDGIILATSNAAPSATLTGPAVTLSSIPVSAAPSSVTLTKANPPNNNNQGGANGAVRRSMGWRVVLVGMVYGVLGVLA